MKFPSWPSFSDIEADIAREVLLSNRVNYWTGTHGREFEREYANYFKVSHAIALANGTVALDLALKGLGIGYGDEVIVTPRSFIASASAVVNSGARAVFADVDRDSQNITADSIERVLTSKTRAIVCVHLAGWPCDMDQIMALARSKNLMVIEDCAQAHGAMYKGQTVGSFGNVGAWSFCQDKIMTTAGEGGMVTTNDPDLSACMWSFKDHGKSYEKTQIISKSTGFRYIHDSIGTNWRITEIQAAIGKYQLTQLPEWTRIRKGNGKYLTEALDGVDGLRVTSPPVDVEHAYYKYYLFVSSKSLGSSWDRDRIVAEIHASGTPCFTGSCPEIYREKAFTGIYGERERHPVAAELGETSILLNVHPGIEQSHLDFAVENIKAVMSKAVL